MQPVNPTGSSRGGQSKKAPRKGAPERRGFKIAIIIAVAFALLAVLALLGAGAQQSTADGDYVVFTTTALTPYTQVRATDFEIRFVPSDYVEAGALAGSTSADADSLMASLGGQVTINQLAAGEQVHEDDFTQFSQLREKMSLDGTQRLFSIEAMPVDSSGGNLMVGDHVDVYAVSSRYEIGARILTDVPIVDVTIAETALDSIISLQASDPTLTIRDLLPADPYPGIYTLAIDAADLAAMSALDHNVTFLLALRPFDAIDDEAAATTASIIETLCPDVDLTPYLATGNYGPTAVGPDTTAADGEPAPDVTPVPNVCIAQLLAVQQSIDMASNQLTLNQADQANFGSGDTSGPREVVTP